MVTRQIKTIASMIAVAHVHLVCPSMDRAWFGRVPNTGVAPEAGFMR